jgi:hypothetical protein
MEAEEIQEPQPVKEKPQIPAKVKYYCQWVYTYTPKKGMKCNKWIKMRDRYKNEYPQIDKDLCHYHINQHLKKQFK